MFDVFDKHYNAANERSAGCKNYMCNWHGSVNFAVVGNYYGRRNKNKDIIEQHGH